MKEKIRKKTKRPQTEDMIFTEEDFEDVSEETKANSPKHRKRSRRTSGGFPAKKSGDHRRRSHRSAGAFISWNFCIFYESFLYKYNDQRKRFFGKIGIICGGIYQRAGKRLQTDH